MKKYRARTLFNGWRIGLDDAELYVGVDEKAIKDHTCMVVHTPTSGASQGYMVIKKNTPPIVKYFHDGKRNEQGIKIMPDHWLWYYKWKPYTTKEKKDHAKSTRKIDKLVQTTQNAMAIIAERDPKAWEELRKKLAKKSIF